MSKRGNPVLIGAFVLGAVVLVVLGAIVFGGGRFFRRTFPAVCYFAGNVNGLAVGAPVKFKGVDIGAVTRILIRFEREATESRIPVEIEFDEDKLARTGVTVDLGNPAVIQQAVDAGLRARLEATSFVTGVLYVYLDYFPDIPAVMAGSSMGIPEIPTLPTQLEQAQSAVKQILGKLDRIDFRSLVGELTATAESIQGLARSPEIKSAIVSLDETLASVRGLVDVVKDNAVPMQKTLEETAAAFQRTATETQRLEKDLAETIKTIGNLVDPRSPLAVRLNRTLDEVHSAARGINQLADYLSRNPNAFVVGRPPEGRSP